MSKKESSVDPSVYTDEYYFTDCTGYAEFKESYGEKIEGRLEEVLRHIKITPGMRILDIGCGRGEVVLYVARHGAEGIGIDYSKDAIKLAKEMRKTKVKEIRARMKFYHMNAKRLKFPKSFFDIIIMTDVAEHLYDKELNKVFTEIKRVLKKDGILALHTAPNKLFFDIGYKYYSYPISSIIVTLWNKLTGSHYPNIEIPYNLRTSSHAIMHVNEPTYFSLSKLFRQHMFLGKLISSNIVSKKPSLGIKDKLFNFIVYFHPLSMYFPLNIFLGSDFVAILRNKK